MKYYDMKPESFTLNMRMHRVSGWMEVVHEMLEDLIASETLDRSVALQISFGETDKNILFEKHYPGSFLLLSNGMTFPTDYSEAEYADACRAICLACEITPCEMQIYFQKFDFPQEEPSEIVLEDTEMQIPYTEHVIEPEEVLENQDSNEGVMQDTTQSVSSGFQMYEFPFKKRTQNFMNEADEIWLKIQEEEIKPIENANANQTLTDLTWEKIIEDTKDDATKIYAAKRLKKEGIRPPDVYNMTGLNRFGKVGGEALFVWKKENVVYLTGLQRYCQWYFIDEGFRYVIVDDLRELIKCFENQE